MRRGETNLNAKEWLEYQCECGRVATGLGRACAAADVNNVEHRAQTPKPSISSLPNLNPPMNEVKVYAMIKHVRIVPRSSKKLPAIVNRITARHRNTS